MSVFNYDISIDYAADTNVSIATTTSSCNYCHVLKWKKEARGLCCCDEKRIYVYIWVEMEIPPDFPRRFQVLKMNLFENKKSEINIESSFPTSVSEQDEFILMIYLKISKMSKETRESLQQDVILAPKIKYVFEFN